MPRSIHPTGEGHITIFLIMITNAQLSSQKETIRRNGSSWTSSTTQIASFTRLQHRYFLPTIFLAGHVRVNSYKLQETSHTRNITNIIPAVADKTTSRRQQFKGQCSSCHIVSFFTKYSCERILNLLGYAFVRRVGWRKNEWASNPIPSENGSSLRSRNSDNNHRLRLRQAFRDLEANPCKPLMKELTIQQVLTALFLYLFL